MYFRFYNQRVGIPTISNRLYLKLGALGFRRSLLVTITGSMTNVSHNLSCNSLVSYNTGISY